MCERCDELIAEVQYLRSELGLQLAAGEYELLRAAFGVTPAQHRILMTLLAAKGRPVTRYQIEDRLKSDAENSTGNLISVHLAKLRKKIGPECIATVWGEGYRLTSTGLAKIAVALEGGPETQKDIAA